jgi:hypothetical protein
MKAVVDEEGHLFPRGVPIEVCTDTAEKLGAAPYTASFSVVGGSSWAGSAANDDASCGVEGCC